VYTVFAPYSPSHSLSPPPPLSHWYQPPKEDLFHPPILWFCKRKRTYTLYIKIITSRPYFSKEIHPTSWNSLIFLWEKGLFFLELIISIHSEITFQKLTCKLLFLLSKTYPLFLKFTYAQMKLNSGFVINFNGFHNCFIL
jgi:hypothetical protein